MLSVIPFGQPILVGHHSEGRDRNYRNHAWNKMGAAVAQQKLAEHHESKAKNLESALDRTIFSDDDNAVEAIEARIAQHEAQREQMKKINSMYRKGDAAGLAALGIDLENLKAKLVAAGPWFGKAPHMPYEMSNLGGRIQADKKRLEAIKAQQSRQAEAAATENGVVIKHFGSGITSYSSVTFAEKPERPILNALRDAQYTWGGGRWCGPTENLPACVAELVEAPEPEPEQAPRVIKGAPGGPDGKWEEVQAIQHEPFVYIMSNGSKWAGEEADDIAELLAALATHRLDDERFDSSFYSVNPCQGERNPAYCAFEKSGPTNQAYIDGARMYECEGVYRFFGNFLGVSHVFHIDTNHKPTIDALIAAIEANKNLPA
jgi:hypothetical protein